MSEILSNRAPEEGTFIIVATYKDEDNVAVTPVTMAWTLTDKYKTVINSRTSVTITTMSSVHSVVLSGDDLALQSLSDDGERHLALIGTYNSTHGTGLPLVDEIVFYIDKFTAVT